MPTTPNLDTKELEFVGDVFEVLRASHYHLLTAAEWRIAQAEQFSLTLPLEVRARASGRGAEQPMAGRGRRGRPSAPDTTFDHPFHTHIHHITSLYLT